MTATHPNATIATGTGVLGILTVFALQQAGVDLPASVAAAVPVGLTTIVLFVGRRGLRGLARILWKGDPTL